MERGGTIDVGTAVSECRASHGRLFDTVDALDDSARPSLLPGWSVGHVLTHLAPTPTPTSGCWRRRRRAGGRAVRRWGRQRAHDIGAGAGRGLAAIVDDLRDSVERLPD